MKSEESKEPVIAIGKPETEILEQINGIDLVFKLVHGFYGIGAVGWAPNPHLDFDYAWRRYLKNGIVPEWRSHPDTWKEKLTIDEIKNAFLTSYKNKLKEDVKNSLYFTTETERHILELIDEVKL